MTAAKGGGGGASIDGGSCGTPSAGTSSTIGGGITTTTTTMTTTAATRMTASKDEETACSSSTRREEEEENAAGTATATTTTAATTMATTTLMSSLLPTTSTNNRIPVDRNWFRNLVENRPNPNQVPYVAGKRPILVAAPMVDQSDLPFRMLCRRYGLDVCFTPMIHTGLLVSSEAYRYKFLPSQHYDAAELEKLDRPLIAQICGSNPETALEACRMIEPHCDGIDINCGCPQAIAKRGHYGAFLLEQEDKLLRLVRYLLRHLTVPLSVKVRLLPGRTREESVEASLALYEKLVDAGIHMLTVHGRTRLNKGPATGQADWDAIRTVVERFGDRIPILANGSISCIDDALECWKATGADGVMSSEAILEYPALFYNPENLPSRNGSGSTSSSSTVNSCSSGSSSSSSRSEGTCKSNDGNDSNANRTNDNSTNGNTTNDSSANDSRANDSSANDVNETEKNESTDASGCGTGILVQAPYRTYGRLDMAKQYLELAERYSPRAGGQGSGIKAMRMHIHKTLHADLSPPSSQPHEEEEYDDDGLDVRDMVVRVKDVEGLWEVIRCIERRHAAGGHVVRRDETELTWYHRHRAIVRCAETGITMSAIERQRKSESAVRQTQDDALADDTAECFACLFGNDDDDDSSEDAEEG